MKNDRSKQASHVIVHSTGNVSTDVEQGPSSMSSLDYWHQLIALVAAIIDEDQSSYTPVFNQLVVACTFYSLMMLQIQLKVWNVF